MSYRLAIAISGAVSLGSYEAGVLFEIVRAIGLHNKSVTSEKNITIDVLTGASAGGMTAVILAQKLLFDGSALDGPYTNHLYSPWVEMADVKGMLLMHKNMDDPNCSIFSSAFIESIANKFLLERYKRGSTPKQIAHPSSASSIHIGLALSNLYGLDYSIPVFDGSDLNNTTSKFTYTCFQDQKTTIVTKADDNKSFWSDMGNAARACGAFPFAFSPLYIERNPSEPDYQNQALKSFKFPKDAFIYTDGGVFNNSPLGMAKTLVNIIDKGPRDYESRFYLYISPDIKGGAANTKIRKETTNFLSTAMALINGIFQQGRFQDWIQTADYNLFVQEFDERSYQLRELIRILPDTDRANMEIVADQLLSHLYADTISLEKDYSRLKAQFMVDDEAKLLLNEKGDNAINAWIKAVGFYPISTDG